MKTLILFLLTLGLAPAASAELRLHPLFSDHAVLQSNSDLPVKGWADPGATVTVTGSWGVPPAMATADASGRWTAVLKAPGPGGPHSLVAESGGQKVEATDLLSGDVWLCGGQSNMEWGLRATRDGAAATQAANHPQIRFFQVPKAPSATPVDSANAAWKVYTPETAGGFSAVGYYFARKIQAETGLAIGLIGSYWGGTRVEPWIDEATLRKRAEYAPLVEDLSKVREFSQGRTSAELDAEHRVHMEELLSAADPGFKAGWANLDVDTSEWKTTEGPVDFARAGAETFDGVMWCRKTIVLPPESAGKAARLHPGSMDDRDITWINGVEIGATLADEKWNIKRNYPVPAGVLRAGTNVIAHLILDTGGQGGMNWDGMQARLVCEGQTHSLAGEWKVRTGVAMAALPGLPRAPAGVP